MEKLCEIGGLGGTAASLLMCDAIYGITVSKTKIPKYKM